MANLIKNKTQMMEYIRKHMRFVQCSEYFNGNPNSIWVSGEDEDTFRGLPIYDYYACYSLKSFELGVNVKWEEQIQKYGWWSEWYDCGTVMIHPLNK